MDRNTGSTSSNSSSSERIMVPAREGRDQQRYEGESSSVRLVAGCVPILRNPANGRDQVVLISSSKNRGWVLPKGGWENDESSEEGAAREAYEEAGVIGIIGTALGTYMCEGKTGKRVKAFMYLLEVKELLDNWPEAGRRERLLVSVEEAGELLFRPEQKQVMLQLRALTVQAAA